MRLCSELPEGRGFSAAARPAYARERLVSLGPRWLMVIGPQCSSVLLLYISKRIRFYPAGRTVIMLLRYIQSVERLSLMASASKLPTSGGRPQVHSPLRRYSCSHRHDRKEANRSGEPEEEGARWPHRSSKPAWQPLRLPEGSTPSLLRPQQKARNRSSLPLRQRKHQTRSERTYRQRAGFAPQSDARRSLKAGHRCGITFGMAAIGVRRARYFARAPGRGARTQR